MWKPFVLVRSNCACSLEREPTFAIVAPTVLLEDAGPGRVRHIASGSKWTAERPTETPIDPASWVQPAPLLPYSARPRPPTTAVGTASPWRGSTVWNHRGSRPFAVLPYKASTLLDTTVSSSDYSRRRGADGVKGLQLASGALALHARHCLGAHHSPVAQPPQAESDPDPFVCAKREIMINV